MKLTPTEITIKLYTGVAAAIKPTAAAGCYVPDKAQFKELDTGKEYQYYLKYDKWYEAGLLQTFPEQEVMELLKQMLVELRTMNVHLFEITEEEVTNDNN